MSQTHKPVSHAPIACCECEVIFQPKNIARKYCYETKCAKSYRAKNRVRGGRATCKEDGCTRTAQARLMCSTHYADWYRKLNGRSYKTHSKTCAFCGHGYETKEKRTTYCSLECAKRDYAGWSKSREVAAYVKPYVDRTIKPLHVRTTNRLTSGKCKVCDAWFISQHMDVTCSDECKRSYARALKQEHKHRRRARKRLAFVSPVSRKRVFESDGYKCHICGKKTLKTKQVPHPMAPTIDHVIPLSKGGTHEPVNCRTAHFMCNALKGDRGTGDQMLLFAA